ncbi:MAG: autotransporter-associated beta strand repeat-containing protein [Verrucomicrobiota bacterium]
MFPGKITGPGTLWHTGGSVNATTAGGSLELQGLNDFSGGLNLLSGAVIFNNAAAVGSGPITFLNGAARLAASANGIVITNHIDLSAVITNSFGLVNDFTLSGDVDLGSAGSDPQINVTNPANTVTFIGSLTNTLGLVKAGAGKVVLTGNNTYGGPTTVLAGNLAINNTTGSGTSSGAVTVSPGSTLSGIGTIAGTVTVNGTVSPANSVGTLSTGGETWEGGGRYVWEMNDAAGTAGSSPGWDRIAVNGTLQINANSGSKFTIDITSLSGTVGGNAANFNNSVAQEWTILTTTGGINSFDPTAFDLVTTSFSNSLGNANFVIKTSPSGNDLVLALFKPLSPTNLVTTAGGSATFTGSPNTGYTVQYTDSLNPINWQTLTTVGVSGVVTTDGTGVGSFTDPDAANPTPPTERYFRIRYP